MRDLSNIAEQAAGDYISKIGFFPVQVAGEGPDGGVDVRVPGKLVAQVKIPKVGRPVVQQIYGIAQSESAAAAVFSHRGFTRDAENWADEHNVGLFLLKRSFRSFRVTPHNSAARALGAINTSGTTLYWVKKIFHLLYRTFSLIFKTILWILSKKKRAFTVAACFAAFFLYQYLKSKGLLSL